MKGSRIARLVLAVVLALVAIWALRAIRHGREGPAASRGPGRPAARSPAPRVDRKPAVPAPSRPSVPGEIARAPVWGRVVGPDRRPLAGVAVRPSAGREVRSDAAGWFGIAVPGTEVAISISVRAGGMTPLLVERVPVPSRDLVLRLVPETVVRVDVVRRLDGAPIPRVRYRVAADRADLLRAEVVPAEPPIVLRPAARIAGPRDAPRTRLWIRLRAGTGPAIERAIPLALGRESAVRIEVGGAAAAAGRVRGPGGRPLPGAAIWVRSMGEAGDIRQPGAQGGARPALAGPEGRFRIEADPGAVRLLAVPPEGLELGFALSDPVLLVRGEVEDVDFEVPEACAIRGTVEGGEGEPVSGARVEVRFLDAPFGGWTGRWRAETDARGGYAIPGLAPGIYAVLGGKVPLLVALDPCGEGRGAVEASFRGGIPLRHGRPAAGAIVGVVTDAGVPLSGVRIEASVDAPAWHAETDSDLEGAFRFPLAPAGRVRLRVPEPGGAPGTRATAFAAVAEGGTARVAIDVAAASLRVRLTAGGAPAAGEVRLVRWIEGRVDLDTDWVGTDARGARAWRGMAAGRYTVQGRCPPYGEGVAERRLAAGERTELLLPVAVAPASLILEVREEATGLPVKDARMVLRTSGGLDVLEGPGPFGALARGGRSDDRGLLELSGIPAGPLAIAAIPGTRWDRAAVVRPLALAPGSDRRLALTLPRAGALLLRARGPGGEPVAGAGVRLTPVSPPGPEPLARRLRLGALFEPGLPPGVWRAEVWSGTGWRGWCTFRIAPGRIARAEIR